MIEKRIIGMRLPRFPPESVVFDCLELFKRLFAIVFSIVHGFGLIKWVRPRRKVSKMVRFCPQSNEELVDPFCVEENPQKITFEDITSAAFKIKCGIINTPCVVHLLQSFVDFIAL